MKQYEDIKHLREAAERTIIELDAFEKSGLMGMDCPGTFVFSEGSARIVVETMDELHDVRKVLREKYGWKDKLANKFCSCGMVIVTYRPDNVKSLPFPFAIWLEAPPETFPKEVLGKCKIIESPEKNYDVVCEI